MSYATLEMMAKYPKRDADGNPMPGTFSPRAWLEDSAKPRKAGCGCGTRAVQFVKWLGVPGLHTDYVRKHHFRATLQALLLFVVVKLNPK